MPFHDWSDDDFNFKELDKAAEYLAKMYAKCTGKYLMWKEKYGTIRYEYESLWMGHITDAIYFQHCLDRTIKKFPQYAGELADDASSLFYGDSKGSFYAGITYLHDCLNKEKEYH